MSKKVIFENVVQAGQSFGRKTRVEDITDVQDFAHAHVEQVTADFLTESRVVAGFDFSFPASFTNSRDITILAPGRVYEANGKQYELPADTTITVPDADPAFSRIDSIVAVIEENVATAAEVLPFVRLRTQAELEAGANPFAPTQLNQVTQKHNRAVVQLRQGTAGENIAPPVLNSNEVLLYFINVPAGTENINEKDINDARQKVRNVQKLDEVLNTARRGLAELIKRVSKLENELANFNIDLTPVYGRILSLAEVLADLDSRLKTIALTLPEILTPKLQPTDANSGKIPASGGVESGVAIVDIELEAKIRFGDAEVALHPFKFPPQLNARFTQIAGGPSNVKEETPLTLAGVTLVASDGTVDFALRNAQFPTPKSRPACAARDNQYVEIFGGLSSDNQSALGDWRTYDSINDTLTARAFSNDIPPNSARPWLYPLGSTGELLLVCPSNVSGVPSRWFRFNGTSGVSNEKSGTLPTGVAFYGDQITEDKVFIVAVEKTLGGFEPHFWEYNITADSFNELGVTGNLPACTPDYSAGCFLRRGEFVLVEFTPNVSASGKTYVFSYENLTWTELSIAPPYLEGADKQLAISRFSMASVGGRPRLVGGLLVKPTDNSFARIWELSFVGSTFAANEWRSVEASFPPLQDAGFCATIGEDKLPGQKAFLLAGANKFSATKTTIYASVQGGLEATVLDGQPAITLAASTTFARFIIAPYVAPFDIGAYFATFAGKFGKGDVKIEVSFNDGVTFHEIKTDNVRAVTDSTNPGKRLIRITLYGYSTRKPILSKLTEIFDADGVQLGDRVVLRYNADLAGVRALYLSRTGEVTISAAIEPSTPEKALLQKITPNGAGVAPTVKNYVNKRRSRIRRTGTNDGSPASVQLDNELAVPPSWIDAKGTTNPDGILYQIATPAVAFDSVINLAGVEVGDGWIVELEA
jgi:hypothetical protein